MWTRLLIAFVASVAFVCGTCAYRYELESKAPVVETCVKHPSTRRVIVQ